MSKAEKREAILAELAKLDREAEAVKHLASTEGQKAVLSLQAEIAGGGRRTFQEELAEAMLLKPSPSAKKLLAETDPLAHAQYVKLYAGLAGLAEKHEIDISKRMSDVEMAAYLTERGFILPDAAFPHELDASADETSDPE